jgi:succinate dehydrogenase / fumarate reductase flavoprotein subunit
LALTYRTHTANVLVIGTRGAGLRAAITAHVAGCDVTLVGKRSSNDAHTVLAAGGINAALGTVDPEDSWQQHFVDTWQEGYVLGNPRTIELLAREAPAAIMELAEWGCPFARTPDGRGDAAGCHRAAREPRRPPAQRLPCARSGARAQRRHHCHHR